MSGKLNLKLLSLSLFALIFVIFLQIINNFIVDIFWFAEVGYLNIFLKRIQTELGCGFFVFLASSLFLFLNLNFASQYKWGGNNKSFKHKPQSQALGTTILLSIVIFLCLLIGLMLVYYGQIAYSTWQIDYNIPRAIPVLPSPLAFRYLSDFFTKLYENIWPVFLLILVIFLILRTSEIILKIISFGLSVIFALVIAGNWTTILQWFNATKFNEIDPQFKADISFYIFKIPGLRLIDFWLGGLFLYTLIAITLIYLLSGNSLSQGKFRGFSRPQLRHIYGLGGAIFTVLAWRHWFKRYDLLYSQTGVTYGASYTDINIQIPLEICLTVVAILISIWLFWKALTGAGSKNTFLTQFSGRSNRLGRDLYKIPFSTFPFYFYIVLLIMTNIGCLAVQSLIVEPNELEREYPYLIRNIEYTRKGFNLNKTIVNTFDPTGELNQEKIADNPLTIKNIRLWDTRPLLQTNRQLQQIRPYYKFFNADIDRYTIKTFDGKKGSNSEKQQVIISARELDYNSVPQQAQTWVNEHLVYTHGYGFTLSPVNLVDEGGFPYYFVKDIGVEKGEQALITSSELISYSIPIGKPRIYYGELTDTYIMTSTKLKEFDFPSGQDNVYNVYDGTGGINIGSYWRRLVFAVYLKDWQMLFTQNFTQDTKLLFRRNISERLRKIAPFLRYDQDPYLVVADAGNSRQKSSQNYLYWIVDAYTTSSYYPYSDPGGNKFNYIRNSVKIVIDAYNGDVQFYIADSEDPIIQTWAKIFKYNFQPLENMPETLKNHIRYPEDLFYTQSERLLTYHMLDPQVFYNREDLWRIPKEIYGSESLEVEPYYLIIKLPTAKEEEFILVHLYTPSSRNNLIAMLFGLSDGENYGKSILYVLPKQKLVYGTEQIEARINQDPVISQQISLWNRKGSKVIQGNLLVIPIEKSLLYVEPIYLEAEQNSLPTLVRVILVYKNQIIMAESLNEGLNALFNPQDTLNPTIIRPIEELNLDTEVNPSL